MIKVKSKFGVITSETSDSIAVHISQSQSSVLSEMDGWSISSRTASVSESPTSSCEVSSINNSIGISSEVHFICSQSESLCISHHVRHNHDEFSFEVSWSWQLTLWDYNFCIRAEKFYALQKKHKTVQPH